VEHFQPVGGFSYSSKMTASQPRLACYTEIDHNSKEVSMSVITVSRELGSQGDLIAAQVANRLGYQLVDKTTIEKVFIQFGYIDFKETYETVGFWANFDPHRTEMVGFLNRVIAAMVHHNHLILVGRGGFALLKNYAEVLNVRIQAPFKQRAQHLLVSQQAASLALAEELVRESDRLRRDFVNAMYAERWDSVTAFDLVIDTGKISPALAVDWLEAAARQIELAQPKTGLSLQAMEIDPVLADSVASVLDGQPV